MRLAGFAALLAGALGCPAEPVREEPDRSTAQKDATAQITRGPYLLRPTPDGVTIAWHTDRPATSRIEVAAAPESFAERGESFRISNVPGLQHEVTLRGLEPATLYSYRVVSTEVPSAVATFRTAPEAGVPVRLVAFGDTRSNSTAHQMVVDAVVLAAPDVVVETGDLAFNGLDEEDWTTFFAIERDLLRSVACYPAIGNHEHAAGGNEVWAGYFRAAIGVPGTADYSFDYGALHVTILSSESGFAGRAQVSFLDADLESAHGRGARFLVVALHRPLYTSAFHAPETAARAILEPVLRARGVQLVLQGHNHLYERFEVGGITYVTTGGGGAPPYRPNRETETGRVVVCPPLGRPSGTDCYHYVQIDVAPEGGASAVAVRASDGSVIDAFSWSPMR